MSTDPATAVAAELPYRRIAARHPHWSGFLLLSVSDDTVIHEGPRSRGTYRLAGRVLNVAWEKFGSEDFIEVDGVYTHHSLMPGPAQQVQVRSFDIFDTLVARRCVAPHGIFDAVERKSGLAGFAEMRRRAEAALYSAGEYTLDEIYRRMSADSGLSGDAARALRALELQEEFSNLIPVAQHVAEVRPGDVLVSDMYLPKDFVSRVLREKCGLHANPLYLSSHGKSSGKAWDVLSRHFRIQLHTGDNLHSDVEMSRRRGIPSRHTTITAMTEHERALDSLGYAGLARAVREARLAFWHADPELLGIGWTHIGVNFPLLFLASLRILSLARTGGYRNILFSSRDCYLLHAVFQHLADRLGEALHAEYFFTSRIARAAPSSAYLGYLDSLSRNGRTLIVDLCGTGWSLTRLLEAAGRADIDIFLLHHIAGEGLLHEYRRLGEITRSIRPLFVTTQGTNVVLEALNTASHEMVLDVVQAQDVYVPVFLDQPPDSRVAELVSCGERAVALALRCAEQIDPAELRRYASTVETAHIEACYGAFHSAAGLVRQIVGRQLSENQHLPKILQSRSAGSGGAYRV